MKTVSLANIGTTMGKSEVRAASGALSVVAGMGAILLENPVSYIMPGCVWLAGALGRATSLLVDGTTTRKWASSGPGSYSASWSSAGTTPPRRLELGAVSAYL